MQTIDQIEAQVDTNQINLADAIAALQQLAASSTPPPDAPLLLAILYAQADDYTQTLAMAAMALEQLDDQRTDYRVARFYHAYGRAHAMIGLFESALSYVQRAHAIATAVNDPISEASIYLTLALIYSRLGRQHESEQMTQMAIAMPMFDQLPAGLRSDHLHDLAETEFSRGELEQARVIIEQAIALKRDSWNLATYASIIGATGDHTLQRQLLEDALSQLAPGEYQPAFIVRSALGKHLLEQGDIAGGIAQLEAAIAIPDIDPIQQDEVLHLLAEYALQHDDAKWAYTLEHRRYELLLLRSEQQQLLQRQAFDIELREQIARRERTTLEARNQELEAALAEQQRLLDLVRELSAPLLPLGRGVLILPVIGSVDSYRIQDLLSRTLYEVAQQRAHALILDITGVPVVDTQVAAAILNLSRSVALLGCRCVLVGIRPEIAQTIVGLGVNLGELRTCATIVQGLAAIGLRIGPA